MEIEEVRPENIINDTLIVNISTVLQRVDQPKNVRVELVDEDGPVTSMTVHGNDNKARSIKFRVLPHEFVDLRWRKRFLSF